MTSSGTGQPGVMDSAGLFASAVSRAVTTGISDWWTNAKFVVAMQLFSLSTWTYLEWLSALIGSAGLSLCGYGIMFLHKEILVTKLQHEHDN